MRLRCVWRPSDADTNTHAPATPFARHQALRATGTDFRARNITHVLLLANQTVGTMARVVQMNVSTSDNNNFECVGSLHWDVALACRGLLLLDVRIAAAQC